MKKYLFIAMVLFFGNFLADGLFAATFDLTGNWNYTLSNNWAVGDMGCSPGPPASGTCTIEQTGDAFTFAYTSGVVCSPPECCTFEGTVDDADYMCSTKDTVDDEGGTVTSTITFTALSATSASGSGISLYTHPSEDWKCQWGNSIFLTKSDDGVPSVVSGGPAEGTAIFLSQGRFEAGPTNIDAPGDAPAVFPFGLIDFTIGGLTNGSSVTVAFNMPEAVLAGAVYYKYQDGIYTRHPDVTGLNDGDARFTITLTDGGSGDADGQANGVIVDPGGIGLPVSLYFPHIAASGKWETEISVINTSAGPLTGIFKAYSNSGELVSEIGDVSLASHARREITVGNEFLSPADIGYIIFESDSNGLAGYTKFYVEGHYRVAIPAVSEINTGDIYICHIASDTSWGTGISLLNTTSSPRELTLAFDNGATKTVTLAANEHKAFTVRSLFGEVPRPDIHSAVVRDADGIIGLELFTSAAQNQMSGILLKDDTAAIIHYPHVAAEDGWATGIVAYNPWDTACNITITPYSAEGTPLTPETDTISANKKYIGMVSGLGLPVETAWLKVDASGPISGFELFTRTNQLAGYTGVGIAGTEGVFAKLEKYGATGIAFVNVENALATVTLTAYDDNGSGIAMKTISLDAYQKVLDTAEGIFSGDDICNADYINYSSTKKVVGFQLNVSSDGMMLDALPGM